MVARRKAGIGPHFSWRCLEVPGRLTAVQLCQHMTKTSFQAATNNWFGWVWFESCSRASELYLLIEAREQPNLDWKRLAGLCPH